MPNDTLRIDNAMLEAWRSNSAYDYNRELMQSDFSLREWLLEHLRRLLNSIFGSSVYEDNRTLIWIVVGIVVLATATFLVSKYRSQLFGRRSESVAPDYDITEDTIYGIDFESAISRAMESKNYREALRLIYLQTLKRLTDDGRIAWQPYKTPTQYVAEQPTAAFREFSHHFLRVRYGGFKADKPLVDRMLALQEEIQKEDER